MATRLPRYARNDKLEKPKDPGVGTLLCLGVDGIKVILASPGGGLRRGQLPESRRVGLLPPLWQRSNFLQQGLSTGQVRQIGQGNVRLRDVCQRS